MTTCRSSFAVFAVAFACFPGLLLAGSDVDGDGVADNLDDCSNTPAGTLVDAAGRPIGDLDGDCDADVADFNLFMQSVTGPLPPWNVELCDDGVDNDDDQLADCADADDCPTGALCAGGLHCSEFWICGCPAGYGDCDGLPENGCETLLNSNPSCSAEYLGAISGDTGAGQLQIVDSGEGWFRVHLTENNDGDVYLSATVQLDSAEGTNYDLYLQCANCGTGIAASSINQDAPDFVRPRWDDDFWGEDDSYDVILEVRWVSGGCGDYTLTVFGNTDLDGYPNTCNP